MTKQTSNHTITRQIVTAQHVGVGLIAVSTVLFTVALGVALAPASTSIVMGTLPNVVTASPNTATAVTLTWTAPGDDAKVGQATRYDIRYSNSPITAGNFSQANVVSAAPNPQVAGSTETVSVTGLLPETTYYFALKTIDDAGNVSGLSNMVNKKTTSLATACVPTYTCSDWSSCVDGFQSRTCSVTNVCPTGLDQPIAKQTCTTPTAVPTTTQPNGSGGVGTGTTSVPTEAPGLTSHLIIVGAGAGTSSAFRIVDPQTKRSTKQITPFSSANRKGLTLAIGDVDGDHQADVITGNGVGGSGQVRLYRSNGQLLTTLTPYSLVQTKGVSVALGDIDGDRRDELITIPIAGASQLRVWRYNASTKRFILMAQTYVYDKRLLNGFTVSAGDLDNDGRAEMVVAPRRSGSSISVVRYSTTSLRVTQQFRPYPVTFTTGLTTTIGDVDGNGRQDIIVTPGPSYYSHLKVVDARGHTLGDFIPNGTAFRQGLSLSTLDMNHDGRDEILAAPYQGPDTNIHVYRYSTLSRTFGRLTNLNPFSVRGVSGLRIASE